MKAEASFNHRGEPVVNVFPESQEEIDILLTMRGKPRSRQRWRRAETK